MESFRTRYRSARARSAFAWRLAPERQTLTAMFVRQGLWLTAIGVAIGLATSFLTMRLMASLLFNVSPLDPWTYGTADLCVMRDCLAWLPATCPRGARRR